jgi:DNA-binding NarL/FixJ family response regulator
MSIPMSNTESPRMPAVYIYSNHPLAYRMMEKILQDKPYDVHPFSPISSPTFKLNQSILVIDCCSVKEWLPIAIQSQIENKVPIIFVSDSADFQEQATALISLGVRGLISPGNVDKELGPAVDSVHNGRLWLNRHLMESYVLCRNGSCDAGISKLTVREEQIMTCLLKGLVNKEISHMFGISVRTVKFHVSNILNKLHVKNRRSLLRMKPKQ